MAASTVTLGLIQMQARPTPAENLAVAQERIRAAAAQGAQIICLQELFASPYFCQHEDARHFALAEPIPGPTTSALARLAAALQVVLIVPLFERRTAGLYHNSAVILDADGTCLGTYRKMHLPDDPGYYEKFYFAPGDLGFHSYATRYGRIGVLICWDQWFPEAARLTALGGAQVLFYPSAIGWHDGEPAAVRQAQHEAWEVVQRSHAIANGVYVAAVNRVGREGEVTFWGASFVAAPDGRVLARAAHDEEAILVVTCDLAAIERMRHDWPFLRDRRIDAYAPLTCRFLDHAVSAAGGLRLPHARGVGAP
ncbi:MAG: apolipoprotein acyltransferase [Candidatus Tectimicrobiota bacterium]|nr:MAG: apolipoprotein acyltransferase [Candidatus Tectomicrobia bacterium]